LNLRSSADKFDSIVDGIEAVIKLEDPTGKIQSVTKLDEGLELYKVSCPIGVLLIIFEARPEVLVNIAALAVKSGAQRWILVVLI
jgi:glutamate-5-semialdehyde dehydrogenase